jgi:exodeoxyribonuclease V beta subunit
LLSDSRLAGSLVAFDRRIPGWLGRIDTVLQRGPHPVAALDEIRDDARKILDRVGRSPAQGKLADALREAMAMPSLDEAICAELLPHIVERIRSDKAERGQFDYDDMLRLVHETLRGPRGNELAARIRARTPWVMIDELQDTDPTQWAIFRAIWLHPDARGMTIVGDPKQSIYGFRGADVTTYQHARDELVRLGADVVALDVNRRSTEPLVAAVNAILCNPFAPLLDKAITYERPVIASGDVASRDARPPVTVLRLESGDRDASLAALARAIGAEIEALRARPPVWQRRGTPQPFVLGDVLVLTRTNRDSVAIASALRARGLPCALVENDRLFETREAGELATVLAAIAAPRDRSVRMRALRTRFFDVPWTDLMRVVDAPDHHPLLARLFDWAALAQQRTYETLFRRLVEDSRFAERALVLGNGERAIVNTWHLIELLLEEVARSRCSLHELVSQLRRWIADRDAITGDRDIQRTETDGDAVRVLTIHKAKGLEAPYVFVFGAIGAPPSTKVHAVRDAADRALVVDPHDASLKTRLQDALDAENQRLAYVALTRAQVRLYLPLYGDLVDNKSAYYPIERCLKPLVEQRDLRFEIADLTVGQADAPPPPDALVDLDVPAPPVAPELAPLAPGRAGLAVVSYTRLAHGLETSNGSGELVIDPGEFAVEEPSDDIAAGELPPGLDAGMYLHALLEEADLDGVRRAGSAEAWRTDPAVVRLLSDRGRECGIDPSCAADAARIVHAALTEPLALATGEHMPPLATAAAFAREVEFTYPIPGGRGLVRGYIDALVAWDDELWVVDYKSDRLDGRNAADHVAEHYAIQARLYALAADRLRGARRLGGVLFAFVRRGIAVPIRTTDETIAGWSRWLAALDLGEVSR